MEKVIRQQTGYTASDYNQYNKILRQHPPQVDNGCAKYFSDSDFLGALFSDKRRKSQQTQTADKNSQHRKNGSQIADALFLAKKSGLSRA